ncbi:MAG: lytic transglycosylase domain-containing protein [Chitinophagales bacterium]|nr:lytic transglycosylase domain-containing protein [Chitinophagales bacterium]
MARNSFSLSLIVSVFVLLAFVFSAGISSEGLVGSGQTDSTQVALKILPIKIPMNVEFAGERVPLEQNDVKERFDRELLVNTYWHSNSLQMFKQSAKALPIIEKILKEEGVPDDFKYLAIAESGLRDVISPSSAAGVWQFLKPTAEELGLKVTDEVDERFHLEKSTRAACKYLKNCKQMFGTWTLAAASYNIGHNRMKDIVKQQKVGSYYDLYLNEETSRYIFRIMALKEIFTHPKKYGFYLGREDLYETIPYKTVKVDTTINDLSQFALDMGSNYKNLKLLNPWIRQNKLPVSDSTGYQVRIPLQ